MTVELGHFALILATCVAFIQGTLPLAGTLRDNVRWQNAARPAALLQFTLIALAYGILTYAASRTISLCVISPGSRIFCYRCRIKSPACGAAMKARCCYGY